MGMVGWLLASLHVKAAAAHMQCRRGLNEPGELTFAQDWRKTRASLALEALCLLGAPSMAAPSLRPQYGPWRDPLQAAAEVLELILGARAGGTAAQVSRLASLKTSLSNGFVTELGDLMLLKQHEWEGHLWALRLTTPYMQMPANLLAHMRVHRLVVDEAHLLGTQSSSASSKVGWLSQYQPDYMWLVTGTPFSTR